MINIIKQGINLKNIVYRISCKRCTAIFTYQESDIKNNTYNINYINCPCCKDIIHHLNKNNGK